MINHQDLPLVSIALCTYNGEKYLQEQLDSVVGQSHSHLEIIIVDDGSSDGTMDLLKHYQDRFSNIKVYQNEENLGYIKNFEKAISLCNGDYIALCDQDDIWDLKKIETQLAHIGEHVLIYHDSEFVNAQGISSGTKVSDVRNFYSGTNPDVFLLENCVSGHTILFRKELKSHLQSFNRLIFHDWWIVFIACNVSSITFVDQCLVKYRQHGSASTDILRTKNHSKKQKALTGMAKEFDILKAFYELPFEKSDVLKTLIDLYQQRLKSFFSFSLAFFLYKERKTLLFIKKKSAFSKLNLIIKYAWGYKLKKLLS